MRLPRPRGRDRRRHRPWLCALTGAALAIAGCGSDDPSGGSRDTDATSTTEAPTTAVDPDTELSLKMCAAADDPDAMLAMADEYGLADEEMADAAILFSMDAFMIKACPDRYADSVDRWSGPVVPPTIGPPVSSGYPDPYGPSHIEGWTIADLLEQTGVNKYGATTGLTQQDWFDFSLKACATPDDPDAMLAIADEYGLRGGRKSDDEIVVSMNPFMGSACPSRFGN